jgi:hypothetical protein
MEMVLEGIREKGVGKPLYAKEYGDHQMTKSTRLYATAFEYLLFPTISFPPPGNNKSTTTSQCLLQLTVANGVHNLELQDVLLNVILPKLFHLALLISLLLSFTLKLLRHRMMAPLDGLLLLLHP